jgi:hypothetical protein
MKRLLIQSILVLLLIFNSSCHHNRLKTNEKDLVHQILVQEKEKREAEKNSENKASPEIKSKISGRFRMQENRSVDPQRPPILIDIFEKNSIKRKFKLSNFATSVKYIKLQAPPDTSLIYDPFFNRSSLISRVITDGKQIIFQGLFGLTRYSMQGEFQEAIWKNKTGIKSYGSSIMFDGKSFFGIQPHTPVSLSNGNLYYPFMNGPAGRSMFMKYKFGTNKNLSILPKAEVTGPGNVPGDTLLNSNANPEEQFNLIYGISSNSWAEINNKWNAGKSGSLLVTYNNKGDTICKFSDYDRIINYNKGTYRQSTELVNYYFNGILTIKQEYNDTVFRLIPPNRLLPVFIIDFGAYKVNYMDGLNPDFSLTDRYMLYSLYETNSYLFIRYTKNYDCPNNRKKKSVNFYNAFFDKRQGKLFHQPGFTYAPENLVNDIDGGIPFWPEFITPDGEMIMLVSGKMIKDYINSSEFKEAIISDANRQKQVSLAHGLKPTDMILVFVK